MTAPHRIAIDARRLRTSTGTYIERLLAHLQDMDDTNDYTVILDSDAAPWHPWAANFRTESVRFEGYSVAEQVGFKRYLDSRRFDLVHFCMPHQPVRYRGRSVTTFHDLTLLKTVHSHKNPIVYRVKQFVGRFVFHRVVRRAGHILVPTMYTANDLVGLLGADPGRITVTPEAAEITVTERSTVPGVPEHFLLYVGRQSDYKNIGRLAEAHQALRRTHPDLALVLAGGLDPAALHNRDVFARAGMAGIHFTGWVDDAQLNELYRTAAAFVFPSLLEGFGLPGLEAMIRGLPVVSSTATCLPEVYGAAAEYFDPTDAGDLAAAIARVIDDPRRRAELIRLGAARAAEFSWRRMAEQTRTAYLDVLAGAADRVLVQTGGPA